MKLLPNTNVVSQFTSTDNPGFFKIEYFKINILNNVNTDFKAIYCIWVVLIAAQS